VEDKSTADLMMSFYSHRREGMTNANALRAAQVEMIHTKDHNNPFYWAAFCLTGYP